MDNIDRLDICEALYGKLEKAFNKFYRSRDRKHLVHLETGQDLLANAQYTWNDTRAIQFVNSGIVRICKEAVIHCNEGIVTIYNRNCNVVAKIKKDVPAAKVREIVCRKSNRIVYIIGGITVVRKMTVCVLSYDKQEMINTYFNATRIFDSSDCVEIVTLEKGKMETLRFER